MAEKKQKRKKVNEFQTPYTVLNAYKEGSAVTKLSFLIMGFGNVAHKQFVKGFLFFAVQLYYIYFMLTSGLHNLTYIKTLGTKKQEKVWNDKKGVFEYVAGDNSLLILLFIVATLAITLAFILVWKASVKSAYKTDYLTKRGKKVNKFKDDIKDLFNQNLHKLLLTMPLFGIILFTIIPLVFMISMAFTTYSKENDQLVLFSWSGMKNFARVLNFGDSIGKTFWSVLAWTLVWAVLATLLNYVFGMILAILINRNGTKIKGFWRFCFVLSIAVPQFVSLLIMRTMLQPEGAVNILLRQVGLLDPGQSLPFWTNVTWARVTVIVINLWVGIPYTMLQVTGILQNIPGELYESAKVDGANSFVTFFKITLPYMLFVTTPYLITQFTGNINNFNVIFLLSGGNPQIVGSTAGKTDLLVTWLYKLTIDKQYYNIGAVIGILTFIILAVVALLTYRNTGSYKNEEGFQ